MKLKGIRLYFLYCKPEYHREFNHWYDTDHLPEFRALPGIFHAQRYVAIPDIAALRMKSDPEEGGGNYMTVYFTEREVQETWEFMAALSKRLREQNRSPGCFHGVFRGNFSLDACTLRRDLFIDPGAVPVMPHKGIYVTLDDPLDSTEERRLQDFFETREVPVMLECPGVAAAFRFRCLERPYLNRILHFYFLDGDPMSAANEIRKRLSEQGTLEELTGLSRVAQRIFARTYRAIIPLQHDFLSLEEEKKQH